MEKNKEITVVIDDITRDYLGCILTGFYTTLPKDSLIAGEERFYNSYKEFDNYKDARRYATKKNISEGLWFHQY